MKRNRINIVNFLEKVEEKGIVKAAEEYNISRVTAHSIIKDLEEKGIIIGKELRINYKILGLVDALIGVNCKPQNLMNVKEELSKLNAKEIYRTSGDHDFIVRLVGEKEEIESTINKIEKIEGVENVYPAFIEDILK